MKVDAQDGIGRAPIMTMMMNIPLRLDELAKVISPQQRYAPLRRWCIGLAITAAGVIASYLWLDQPLAFFVHRNVADKTIFVWLQRLPLAFPLLSSLILAWCGLWTLMDLPFSRVQSIALTCSISFISTSLINSQLKYAFGRTWPGTWIENNPSLFQNSVFGFNPFHGGPGFASFPSGHAAGICSVIAVLWWSYPSWRPIYIACVAAVAIGLIGANYHFLSDILSAIFIGLSVGYITTKMSVSKRDRFT
jgi:membrane-associated phospholipid phosphatase